MSFRHRAEAALLRALLALSRALGPVRASNLGGAIARAVGPRLAVSRVADRNLRAAMPELDRAARRRIVLGVWDNLGRTAAELPHVRALRRTASGPGWEIEGEAHVRALAARGGPAIFVSGHFGNWEILALVMAACGMPTAPFYRAAANPLVDAMIQDIRAGNGLPGFAKGSAGARGAMQHLARGGYLGVLADQKMNDGIPATLFGLPAMTAPAPAALALRYRCPVLPGHVQRIGPARFRVVADPPLALPDTADRRADVAALTQAVNDALERWIRARPEGWLWLHRRWPKEVTPA